MNNDPIDGRLTVVIDRAIQAAGSETTPAPAETVAELLGAVDEYLTLAVPANVRTAACAVADLARDADLTADENSFRSALCALRDALEANREEEAAAEQLASDPELVQEFLVEARAHLATVESGLLLLEREPRNAEALNSVFRSFHTIKGLAAFLGAVAIQELAHETENLLDLARAGSLTMTSEIVELILKSADELNICLDRAGTMGMHELPRCSAGLLAAIAARNHSPSQQPESNRPEPAPMPQPDSASVATEVEPVTAAPASGPSRSNAETSVVRIETAKLEYLIDMVGELVIAESVVRHDPAIAGSQDPLLTRNLTQLARVVQEVQKTSMSMRMVAVASLFRKMSRLTRDLARKSGKQIDLVTVGDDVELDRSIVEDLADPMVHMIRNAVDHGLEPPEDRKKAGKNETGQIRLRAMHDAGDIVIEISDDGRGMDPARILAKARRQGLVSDQDNPDEETIFRLIFEAGFSTAEKVTDLSGRGVGMDVVRKQIQKLRGRVVVKSVLGQGSTFVLRLPLTLAIIDGLVVGVGSQRYILPMFAIREMFSPGPDTLVTLENRLEAALFRDKLLPLIRLSNLIPDAEASSSDGPADDSRGPDGRCKKDAVLIVVESRDQLYCIAVDQLVGKQEVVIKSLGQTFRDVQAISGGAILGDGRVGLIIDVNSLRYRN
jgi:two-component system chemotaxis sensor kinase CheA